MRFFKKKKPFTITVNVFAPKGAEYDMHALVKTVNGETHLLSTRYLNGCYYSHGGNKVSSSIPHVVSDNKGVKSSATSRSLNIVLTPDISHAVLVFAYNQDSTEKTFDPSWVEIFVRDGRKYVQSMETTASSTRVPETGWDSRIFGVIGNMPGGVFIQPE